MTLFLSDLDRVAVAYIYSGWQGCAGAPHNRRLASPCLASPRVHTSPNAYSCRHRQKGAAAVYTHVLPCYAMHASIHHACMYMMHACSFHAMQPYPVACHIPCTWNFIQCRRAIERDVRPTHMRNLSEMFGQRTYAI